MENQNIDLLQNLFVAQVATLAKAIKAEQRAKGISSSSDGYREALIEIQQNRDKVFTLLEEIEKHY